MCIASSVSPQPFVLKAPISVPVIIDISGSPDRDRLALLSLAPVIAEREAVAIVESDFSKATAQFFESAKRSPDVTVETMLRLLKTPSIGWVYIGWAFQAHATTASLGYTSKHNGPLWTCASSEYKIPPYPGPDFVDPVNEIVDCYCGKPSQLARWQTDVLEIIEPTLTASPDKSPYFLSKSLTTGTALNRWMAARYA